MKHKPLLVATLVVFGATILRGILPANEPAWLTVRPFVLVLTALGSIGVWLHRREPAGEPWGRDPALRLLFAAFALLLGVLASHRFRLTSDGIDHYVTLRSLAVDHDLDFANDYALLSPRGEAVEAETPLGRVGNVHPVGPALLWTPFYLIADAWSRLAGRPADGLGEAYKNAVAVASLLYGWLGLVLVQRTAARLVDRWSALLASLGLAFGTFLYWYLAQAPTMAHAPAFGAAALVVWLWLGPLPNGPRRALLLGGACGLAALVRWPNVLLALLPAFDALPRLAEAAKRSPIHPHRLAFAGRVGTGSGEAQQGGAGGGGAAPPRLEEWRPLAAEGALFAGAALVVFSPQMLVWKLLYGSFLTIPQGAGFLAGPPAVDGVLFSPHHGLFSWSPFLYAGAAGWFVWLRRDPWRALGGLVLFGALTRVNAGVADWWGGSAFGGRRFDAVLPLFGLGAALAFSASTALVRRRPWIPGLAAVVALVGWNLLLADLYRAGTWGYAEPVAFEEMGHAAVSRVDRTVGSPLSLPGSLWTWFRDGTPPADYESLYMRRPFSRFLVFMGDGDRMFLEDGWSEPRDDLGLTCRTLVRPSAGLVVPLHRPAAYRLGGRLTAVRADGVALGGSEEGVRVRVLVNGRPVGIWTVPGVWRDAAVEVPAETLQPGRNQVRFRIVDQRHGTLAVASVWMEPIS